MRTLASLLLALCIVACGTEAEDFTVDAATDTATDGATDTDPTPDVDEDASDAGSDAVADTGSDAAADTGPPSWAACEVNSQCTLAANTCCGVCGQAELGDVDPINMEGWEAHYDSVCDDPDPNCPGCPSMVNPWIGATCALGTCAEFDLRAERITACTSDDECVLRTTGCCECGADTNPAALIAIRGDAVADYTSMVCDPESTCPGCDPEYPGWVEPACNDEGRCYVYYLPD